MTNYLIESPDFLSQQEEITKIITDNNFTESIVNTYDLEETSLENALEDLDTYSFLSSKKTIIIKNIEALKIEENKESINHLLKYIDNSTPDNLLIITANKLNNTYKLTKELKNKCQYINININPKTYIKNNLKDYKIDQNTINYLDEYCLSDITKINNECLKLKNYKIEDKIITKKDIDEVVVKKLGDSKNLTFDFVRSLSLKDKKESLTKYHELLDYNIEPLSLIGLIASQIRILYQVKLLEKFTDKEIADKLEEKSDYRIKKTRELTRFYSKEELLRLMQELSNLDLKIKTTDIDPNSLIELFILNI